LDLRKNENWFQIKLMANVNDNMKAVGNKEYAEAITQRLASFGVAGCHAIHFGRSEGPKVLEMEELESPAIKCLGNWSPGTQEKFYSSKLPLKAMRVSNGHSENKGCHFNPRTAVEPPETLLQSIFPFIEPSKAQLESIVDSDQRKTAWTFLHLMGSLRKVVLQDAAAMMIAGRTHAIFDHHPVFCHVDFAAFKNEMAAALNAAPTDDPVHVTLEQTMPAVLHHFGNLATARNQDRAYATEQFGLVNRNFALMNQRQMQFEERMIAEMNRGFARLEQHQDNFVTVQYMQGMLAHAATYNPPTAFARQTAIPQVVTAGALTALRANGPIATRSPSPLGVAPPFTAVNTNQPFGYHPNRDSTTTRNIQQPNNPDRALTLTTNTSVVPKPRPLYRSATEMFDDWYGIGSNTIFPTGGIDCLDREKTGWRNSYSSAERKQHSRLKYVISQINRKIEQYKGIGHDEAAARQSALTFFDSLMRDERSCKTLLGMERYLQKKMKEERAAQLIEQAYDQQVDGAQQEQQGH
jgi:hypothetical protein